MKNILFYKFINIKAEQIVKLKEEILSFLKNQNIKGKLILASEGINGCLTGEEHNIKNSQDFLRQKFGEIFFKEDDILKNGFKRLNIIIKQETIKLHNQPKVQLKAAQNISPEQLKKWYESNENFLIFDGRNDFEYQLGHFKNAINIKTKKFSDFPQKIIKHHKKIKETKAVFYCTGGIRCEKATDYLIEIGLPAENIYQLEGGIINYGQKVGSKFWQGKCFVFDNRGTIEIEKRNNLYENQCSICFITEQNKLTCPFCQKNHFKCKSCAKIMENCCDRNCRNLKRYRKTGSHKKINPLQKFFYAILNIK